MSRAIVALFLTLQTTLALAEPQGAPPAQIPAADTAAPQAPATPEAPTTPPPAPPVTAPATKPSWLGSPDGAFEAHPGFVLWLSRPLDMSQPLVPTANATSRSKFDLYFAKVAVDFRSGNFALHIDPRFSDGKFRSYYSSNIWVQEVYGSWKNETLGVLKVGKIYSKFGRFFDGTFYQNHAYFDGIKLRSDYGASFEGMIPEMLPFGMNYSAQYFAMDGQASGAFPLRDTNYVPGGRQRNIANLRVEPYLKMGKARVGVGMSAQRLEADLAAFGGVRDVYRGAGELNFNYGPFSAFGEFIFQNGRTTDRWPVPGLEAANGNPAIPGRSSAHNRYYIGQVEYKLGRFTPRYNVSVVDYKDLGIREIINKPSLAFTITPQVQVLSEYGHWTYSSKSMPGADKSRELDKSLNFTLWAMF
jgi:hypothetical protein